MNMWQPLTWWSKANVGSKKCSKIIASLGWVIKTHEVFMISWYPWFLKHMSYCGTEKKLKVLVLYTLRNDIMCELDVSSKLQMYMLNWKSKYACFWTRTQDNTWFWHEFKVEIRNQLKFDLTYPMILPWNEFLYNYWMQFDLGGICLLFGGNYPRDGNCLKKRTLTLVGNLKALIYFYQRWKLPVELWIDNCPKREFLVELRMKVILGGNTSLITDGNCLRWKFTWWFQMEIVLCRITWWIAERNYHRWKLLVESWTIFVLDKKYLMIFG